MLRLNKKNFEDEQLPHELFLTTSQTTDIKLSKGQTSTIIKSDGSGEWGGS